MKAVIGALVAGYFVWVCIKKYKDIKKGKFCGCGCENCGKNCDGKE